MIVGVSGNIGSGKTLVSKMFEELGAHYISADEIGWETLPEIAHLLRQQFGATIMNGDTVDKRKLRNTVFSNRENLDYLNRLSHPILIEKMLRRVEEIESGVVVIDAALLFDWPEIVEVVDFPILVIADKKQKQERAAKKGIDKQLFESILEYQKNDNEAVGQVKFIINNNGTLDALRVQCQNIYREIKNDC